VATLCSAFLAYVTSHSDEYRDQKNPPRRIEEIRKAFEGRGAAEITAPEIEDWLAVVQENRELANATINKLRRTFSMLYKHGKRKGLVNVNPRRGCSPQGRRERCREVLVAGRGAASAVGAHPKH
jgi:site-specific recombinase XerD